MRSFGSLGVLCLVALSASAADAATIAGTVTGPDGAPVPRRLRAGPQCHDQDHRQRAVRHRRATTRCRISRPATTGWRSGRPASRAIPRAASRSPPTRTPPHDLALQKGLVRWSDLSIYQGTKLLPEARGKDLLFTHCMACHGFESRMAAVTRDEDGWRDRVNYMRDAMGFFINRPQLQFNDQKADDIVYYLNRRVRRGLDAAEIAGRPAALQGHGAPVQRRGDEDRLCRIRNARPQPDAVERASGQGRQVLDSLLRRANKIGAARSGDRRDQGIPGAEYRHGGDPFGGAGARRQRLADRAGLQQARPLGSRRPRRSPSIRTTGASTPCGSTPTARCGRPAA